MNLYRLARVVNNFTSIAKGHGLRRAKNLILGRSLGKLGFWRIWR